MADPNSEAPNASGSRRRRSDRKRRRRRGAFLLALLASLVGAAVFAPELVQLVRKRAPGIRQHERPVRTARPHVLHQWRFDFSMGPILELLEQGLRLEPFDLRRPLRIPFTLRSRGGDGDILLLEPGGYLPPLVPSNTSPLPILPGSRSPALPEYGGLLPAGGGVPDGQPDFDPDLTIDDDPLAEPGDPPDRIPVGDPTSVPEPAVALLLLSALLGLSLLRARSAPN